MVTGKVGTDIEERKCSWLVVQALQRISTEQMRILKVRVSPFSSLIVDKILSLFLGAETSRPYFNPLTPKIRLLILLSSCYVVTCTIVKRIWGFIKIIPSGC